MAAVVLVHPAWFGGWCWWKHAPCLRRAGTACLTPTLTGLGERAHLAQPTVDLQTHVEDIVNVLTFEELNSVVLLGHRSSGAVVTNVADRVPERVIHVIYLDVFVPEDGQSLIDLIPPIDDPAWTLSSRLRAPDGCFPEARQHRGRSSSPKRWQVTSDVDLAWLLPRMRPTPIGHFTRATARTNPAADGLPRTYIRCTRWPNAGYDRYAAIASEHPGWQLRNLDSSHIPYVTQTEELAALLDDLLRMTG